MEEKALVWFRRDLRLEDNAALNAAIDSGKKVVPVFIWEPEEEKPWQHTGAALVWLHFSLKALGKSIKERGSGLLIRQGKSSKVIQELAEEFCINEVFANKIYEPIWLEKDAKLEKELAKKDIALKLLPGALLFDPFTVRTQQDNPFQVFTAFWKSCMAKDASPPPPVAAPKKIPSPSKVHNESVEELEFLPTIHWDTGIREAWTPGEDGAHQALEDFLDGVVDEYTTGRDVPGAAGTSRLSPHLHFGEISIRKVWHGVVDAYANHKHIKKPSQSVQMRLTLGVSPKSAPAESKKAKKKEVETNSFHVYLKELGWREFAHHVLCNFPHTPTDPLREDFAKFPWKGNRGHLKKWQKGQTGYPMVDAGMRELWHTGWMHNRVRMIVASFLVKHLLLPWQAGARWFWDTLVDADLANNTLGWQWSAGCGADAAPYFRIFNPILQGEKFDPRGVYVRKWVPELEKVPDEYIHRPWEAPAEVLAAAGVELGKNYPKPIVDHGFARQRALEALASIRK